MTHEEKNIGGRAEHPGSDEQKISEMLSGLARVEAPKDFDFRLKARIAKARPERYRKASLFPILKYAIPLALFLVVGAGMMVSSSYNDRRLTGTVNVPPPSQEEQAPASAANSKSTVLPFSSPGALTAEKGSGLEPEPQLPVRPDPDGGRSIDKLRPVVPRPVLPPGGSRDMGGGSPSSTPIVPPEFRNNTNANTPSNSSKPPSEMTPKPLSVHDALESIGISADLEEKKWRVKSVKGSTIANLMGVKEGDKLESIDGKDIDDKTVYKDGSFKVKTIRVRRGTAIVDLELPKPK